MCEFLNCNEEKMVDFIMVDYELIINTMRHYMKFCKAKNSHLSKNKSQIKLNKISFEGNYLIDRHFCLTTKNSLQERYC